MREQGRQWLLSSALACERLAVVHEQCAALYEQLALRAEGDAWAEQLTRAAARERDQAAQAWNRSRLRGTGR